MSAVTAMPTVVTYKTMKILFNPQRTPITVTAEVHISSFENIIADHK